MAILYGITEEYMNGQEFLNGATLEQLYGEELGASFLKRMTRKTTNVVKKAAPIVATGGLSKVLPKSVGRVVGKVAVTAATGGLNLVPKKALVAAATGGLSLVPKKIVRQAAGAAMTAGRTVARSPLAMQAIKAGISVVPGGGSALQAYNAASSVASRMKSAQRKVTSFVKPAAAPVAPIRTPKPTTTRPAPARPAPARRPKVFNQGPAAPAPQPTRAPRSRSQAPAPVATVESDGIAKYKIPLMIGGGLLAVGGIALAMSKSK